MEYKAISTPEFFQNPYPTYSRMRAEGPLVRLAPRVLCTATYEVAQELLVDRRFGKGIVEAVRARYGDGVIDQPPFRTFRSMLPGLNPPTHTRLRSLLMKAFNARQVERFRNASYDISHELIESFEARGHADLVREFAYVLPMKTICSILDVPFSDASLFKETGERVAGAVDMNALTPEKLESARVAAIELESYFGRVLNERRRKPGDDLISTMILAEDNGSRLSDEEIVANLCFIFVAGHETTENMIGNCLIALQKHPNERARIVKDSSLVSKAVAECLRFDSSVQMTQRVALEEMELYGIQVSKGEMICVCVGGANRDPRVFSNPDVLDIDRTDNRFLSYGGGLHYCLGARLASLEVEAAIGVILSRLPGISIPNTEDLTYRHNSTLRGVHALHAQWET